MDYIKAFLKKKKHTGEEVGRALLLSLINDIKYQHQECYKPLFTQEQFVKIEASLSEPEDLAVYRIYCLLHKGISTSYNTGVALYHQFFSGYARNANALHLSFKCEEVLRNAQKHPVIMTQEQYSRYYKQTEAQLLKLQESFKSLFFRTIRHFDNEPSKAPAEIREALEALDEEPITRERVLKAYKEEKGEGYFVLSTGERSDSLPDEIWIDCLEKIFKGNSSDNPPNDQSERLYYFGAEYLAREYSKSPLTTVPIDLETAQELIAFYSKYFHDEEVLSLTNLWGNKKPPANWQEIVSFLVDKDISKDISWKEYEPSDFNLTKRFALIYLDSLYELSEKEKAVQNKAFKEFKEDFPALYKAVYAYMLEKLPKLQSLKMNQINKPIFSWEELAEFNYIDHQDLIVPIEQSIIFTYVSEDKNKDNDARVIGQGIAILNNPKPTQVDENGDFKENLVSPMLTYGNLDMLNEDKQVKESLKHFKDHFFVPALRYIKAFNELTTLLADAYELKEISEVKIDASDFEKKLQAYNRLVYLLHATVCGKGEERIRKETLVKELFSPVDEALFTPNQIAVNNLFYALKDNEYTEATGELLRDFDLLIAYLNGEGAI